MSAGAPQPTASRARRNAATRILDGAAQCVIEQGAAGVSVHDVAVAANVSKGLIHYHFVDKESLLARLVEHITAQLIERQRIALTGITPRTAVDALWRWVSHEMELGHVQLLAELTLYPAPRVRAAIEVSARHRRAAASESTTQVFEVLALAPRVPIALLADVFVAFMDGLAIRAVVDDVDDLRVSFDVLWLSLLSLAD